MVVIQHKSWLESLTKTELIEIIAELDESRYRWSSKNSGWPERDLARIIEEIAESD